MGYDNEIIILATKKNFDVLSRSVNYIKKNIGEKIIVVTKNENAEDVNKLGLLFFDEDKVVDGLTFEAINNILHKLTGKEKRTGWYFQQFIKMAWSLICKNDNYITLDADTIPLNAIEYIDTDGRYLLTEKIEYNKPYFDTIGKLFNGKVSKTIDGSFVAENMIFDTKIMKAMLNEIVENDYLEGKTWWEKIIRCISPENILHSGFSEFETYGNYINTYYPDRISTRKLRTLREAVYTLGSKPREEQLKWAAQDFDMISIEISNYPETLTIRLSRNKIIQKIIHCKSIARNRQKIRSIYRKIRGREDFLYE